MTLFCIEQESKLRVIWTFIKTVFDQLFRVTLSISNVNRILQYEVNFWNDPQSDFLPQLNQKVDDLKSIMIENIDKVLRREEILTEIDQVSQQLDEDAKQFKNSSKKLKRKTMLM